MTIVQLRLKSLREISKHPSNLNIKPRVESSCALLIVLDEWSLVHEIKYIFHWEEGGKEGWTRLRWFSLSVINSTIITSDAIVPFNRWTIVQWTPGRRVRRLTVSPKTVKKEFVFFYSFFLVVVSDTDSLDLHETCNLLMTDYQWGKIYMLSFFSSQSTQSSSHREREVTDECS